jgi:hypothetical protein
MKALKFTDQNENGQSISIKLLPFANNTKFRYIQEIWSPLENGTHSINTKTAIVDAAKYDQLVSKARILGKESINFKEFEL